MVIKYHKIQSIFKRDPETKMKTFLYGQYTTPEFEYLKDNPWVFTEKVDGTNIRIHWDGEKIIFGGRTENAQLPAPLVATLNDMFGDPSKFLEKFEEDMPITLFGEGYGAKIQKGGGNYRQDQSFVLFDVMVGGTYLQRENVQDIADYFNLETVPILGRGTLDDGIRMCMSGFNSQWGDFQAEGLVIRPETELSTRFGKRIITKIKCKDFPTPTTGDGEKC